ncbi:MAG: hypothetical protein FWF87_09200, partial [Synergistaceae bacterium]|nr:hypothetical protein [Synergistaceae bacterium]
VPIEAGATAPLGIRIPGGRHGSAVDIAAPLGYPAEQRYLPMQAIFIVPRGAYGAGAHDRTLDDPSLLLTEYCKILLQLPDSAGARTIDLFGGAVEYLNVAEAMRAGTLEFFKDTSTGELLAVLNYLLVDGTAPDGNEPVIYDGGLLKVYDGLMDGNYSLRLWLADNSYVNNNEPVSDSDGQNDAGARPKPEVNHAQQSSGGASESSGGCNAAAANMGTSGILLLALVLWPAMRRKYGETK